MLNDSDVVADPIRVVDWADPVVADHMANGQVNVTDDTIAANIRASIRRGHPQMRPHPVRPDRICLVGSGPSLADTEDELRQALWEGATLVTLNGAYHWAIQRNLRPQTQIVMDARATNARFLTPEVPRCNYLLASQCAPALWDTVAAYPHVFIFHAVVKDEGQTSSILDAYYQGNWVGVGGGTTVATRAISLLRIAGYVRYDLFGVDCCWLHEQHHAVPQPENARDGRQTVTLSVKGAPESRQFQCANWHMKQLEDFLVTLKINGSHFTVNVHGDGMLAYALRVLGDAPADDLTLIQE